MRLLLLSLFLFFCILNLTLADVTTTDPPTSTSPETTSSTSTETTAASTTQDSFFYDYEEYRKDLEERERKLVEELKANHEICFTGDQRSPVDLRLEVAKPIYTSGLEFVNYDTTGKVRALESNHTEALFGFNTWKNAPFVRGGTLEGEYILWEYHQNYNHATIAKRSRDTYGRVMHSINGNHHDFEANLIHVKRGMTMDEARGVPGAIVTVAVQYKENSTVAEQYTYMHNMHMHYSTMHSNMLKKIPDNGNEWQPSKPLFPRKSNGSIAEWIRPAELLPTDTTAYFTYNGSLGHAPCSPGVTWFVLSKPVYLNYTTLLRHTLQTGSIINKIATNMIEPPTLGNRTLFFNFGEERRPVEEYIGYPLFGIVFACMVVCGFTTVAWFAVEKIEKEKPEKEKGSVQFFAGDAELETRNIVINS